MKDVPLYLKPNVVMEPLVCGWYAWSHLISPATAAMNVAHRHLEIMDSFISFPEFHEEAVRNPKMRGGPFMELPASRLGDVQSLREKTLYLQDDLIQFAAAVARLETMLEAEAKGYSMEALYAKVPSLLHGYVELFYDRNNHPSFRFFESLLYQSPFYKKHLQSVALWITDNDHRDFCLSTPRVSNDGVLHLPLPFDHVGLDELAAMKRVPQTLSYIREKLGLEEVDELMLAPFFTESAPAPYQKYKGDKIRMRYFGHACILIETADVSILVDPLISYYGYHSDVEHFSDADLPDVIDYVLITHNHQDHILFETLLPLRHKIKTVIVPRTSGGRLEDPDLQLMFRAIAFKHVVALGEMEEVRFFDTVITAIPFIGEHSDLNILTKACYLVRVGGFKLLFLADSRILEPRLYEHIVGHTGSVDVMFLGMECDGAPLSWLYGPLMKNKLTREQDQSRRLSGSDCEKGMALVNVFQPREVYVYAMGMEPWVEFITSVKYTDASNPIVQSNQLLRFCEGRGITAERLYGEKELLYEKQGSLVV